MFESVVLHELVQAMFVRTRCGRDTCLGGHEFIAYALQIESLGEASRRRLIRAVDPAGPVELDWFTSHHLNETPELVAVRAWQYFSRPGVGYDFVAGLVSGEQVFPSELE